MPLNVTMFFRGIQFLEIKEAVEKKKIAVRDINSRQRIIQKISIVLETKYCRLLPADKSIPKNQGPVLVNKP